MRRMILLFTFLALGVLIALLVAELTGFSLMISAGVSVVASLLIYLMLDLKPERVQKDTIYRLTRGSWHRRE